MFFTLFGYWVRPGGSKQFLTLGSSKNEGSEIYFFDIVTKQAV